MPTLFIYTKDMYILNTWALAIALPADGFGLARFDTPQIKR